MSSKCRVCGKETEMKTKLCKQHNNNVVTLNRFNAKPDDAKDTIIGNLSFKLKMFRKKREVPGLSDIDVVRIVERQ